MGGVRPTPRLRPLRRKCYKNRGEKFGKDEVGSSNLPSSSSKNLEISMISRFLFFINSVQFTPKSPKFWGD